MVEHSNKWLSYEAASGNGSDSEFVIIAAEHTGRTARTATLTFSADGVTPQEVTITQEAKNVFVTLSNVDITVGKDEGENIATISGYSNAQHLELVPSMQSVGSFGVITPAEVAFSNSTVTLEGPMAPSQNDVLVDGVLTPSANWGKASKYKFTFRVKVDPNTTIEDRAIKYVINAFDDEASVKSDSADLIIKQTAGDAYLTVSPATLTFAAAGEQKSVAVSSNTDWTVA